MSNRADNFNRANGAIGTPSDAGAAWTAGAGTWTVTSNAATVSGGTANQVAVLECSSANVDVQVTIATFSVNRNGIAWRYSDASNFIYFGINNSGGYRLRKVIAGVETAIASGTLTIAAGDVYKVTANANSITVYQNGVSRVTATESFNNTATKHGLRGDVEAGVVRFDDLSITDLSAVAYTLTADQGSITETGEAAGLYVGRVVTADQGSYVQTGEAAGVLATRTMVAAQGSITETGQDAGLYAGYGVTAAQGSISLTGQDASLLATRTLSSAVGSVALTGQDAGTLVGRATGADAGSFSLDGFAAAFPRTYALTSARGVFTWTGIDSDLTYTPLALPALLFSSVHIFPIGIDGKVFLRTVYVPAAAAPDNTPPAAPTGLTTDGSVGLGGIQLYWDDNTEPDLAGYNVYRSADGGTTYTQLNGGGVQATADYLDASADIGPTYRYRVTAIDVTNNESTPSVSAAGTRGATPPVDDPPAAPAGVTATASLSGIALDWLDNSEGDLAGYRVYVASDVAGPFMLLATITAPTSAYADSTAVEGVATFYRVTATDAASNESTASSVSATRPVTPQGDVVKISSSGTMSPAAVHVYATTHGGNRYVNPSVGVRLGLDLALGTPLTTKYLWEFFAPDGSTHDGDFHTLPGFNAAHLFVNTTNAVKNFKVRLTVTYQNGAKAIYVGIVPVYPDTRTKIYVDAQAGADGNNGLSITSPKKSLGAALPLLNGPDMALLIARPTAGRAITYPMPDTKMITWNNVLIDSYIPPGRTNTELPTVAWTASLSNSAGKSFFAITGKHFVAQNFKATVPSVAVGTPNSSRPDVFAATRGVNLTFNNIEGNSVRAIIESATGSNTVNTNSPDGVLVQRCSSAVLAAWDFYFIFCVGSNWTILGNQSLDPEAACVRVGGVDNLLCYGNIFQRSTTARATGDRSTITSHVGTYHWHAQNHILSQGLISIGPVWSPDGLSGYSQRTDRCKWLVIERNLIDAAGSDFGAINVTTGVEHISIRNNVFTGANLVHVNLFGYDSRYERGVDDVRIDSNTFYQVGGKSVAIHTKSPTNVRVRNNVMYAPNLAYPGCVIQADNGMSCFATDDGTKAIDRNVWPPTLLRNNAATSNVFEISGVRVDFSSWNGQSQVGDDLSFAFKFASQVNGVSYKPLAGTSPTTYGRPRAGVYEDYLGTTRAPTATSWSAGAQEA